MVRARIKPSPARKSATLLADACWIAVASLHQEFASREGFESREIIARMDQQGLTSFPRQSIYAHLHQHCVANVEPSSGGYRMLTRLPDGTVRLFQRGDFVHPKRRGRMRPEPEAIPSTYRPLIDWYDHTYATRPTVAEDLVLAMLGVGREVWEGVDADEYVAQLREGW